MGSLSVTYAEVSMGNYCPDSCVAKISGLPPEQIDVSPRQQNPEFITRMPSSFSVDGNFTRGFEGDSCGHGNSDQLTNFIGRMQSTWNQLLLQVEGGHERTH